MGKVQMPKDLNAVDEEPRLNLIFVGSAKIARNKDLAKPASQDRPNKGVSGSSQK